MSKGVKYTLCAVASLVILAGIGIGVAYHYYYKLTKEPCHQGERCYIYIDTDDTKDSVLAKLSNLGVDTWGWDILEKRTPYKLYTGKYAIEPTDPISALYRRLVTHQQEPVNITIPSVRISIAPENQPQPLAIDKVVTSLSRNIMMDSTAVADCLTDTAWYASNGFNAETYPTLFLPNTYQVYWDITPEQLRERIKQEYNAFWNGERRAKAEEHKLNPVEATILASIVEEETTNASEQPIVAGLYQNRLAKGILLQADPTVKFAVGDWTLRRVLNIHLQKESPYNTYRTKGLPPGPLRIPSLQAIEAVLNATKHDYIYMCAKEDFSGTHNFAVTLQEHNRNAQRYIRALNERGIR